MFSCQYYTVKVKRPRILVHSDTFRLQLPSHSFAKGAVMQMPHKMALPTSFQQAISDRKMTRAAFRQTRRHVSQNERSFVILFAYDKQMTGAYVLAGTCGNSTGHAHRSENS